MAADKYFDAGFNAIEEDKVDLLRKLITILKLKEMSPEDKVKKVLPWIEFCVDRNKDLCLLSILLDLQIAIYLFVDRDVSVITLRKVNELLKLDPLEVIAKVTVDDPAIYARIEFTFYHCPLIKGKQEPMTFEIMQKWEQSFDAAKPGLNTYLVKRLDELREFAPAPKYIIPHENPFIKEEDLLKLDHPERDFSFPSEVDEQADFVLSQMVIKPEDKEIAKQSLLNDWNNFDDPEKQSQFVMDIYKNSFRPRTKEEIETFRIWGPINPIPDEDEDREACYMFGHYSNWFTGVCETCEMAISEYYHAVRAPSGEGWSGCYCSLKCASDDADLEDIQRIGKELSDFGIFFREGSGEAV